MSAPTVQRRVLPILLALFLTACAGGGGGAAEAVPAAGPPPLQVYLFLGQSNMVGVLGHVPELPQAMRSPQPAVAFLAGSWQPYVAGMPLQTGCFTPACFGPEVSFAARKGAVGIVKVAVNGSGLARDWLPTLLSQAVSTARAAAGARPVHFAGAFWMQGETDALDVDVANTYRANLRTLVARLRTELAAPALPFTACRLNLPARDNFGNLYPGRSIVRDAQTDPGIENYRWVNCDGLSFGPDALHFDTASIVKMGELFADVTP